MIYLLGQMGFILLLTAIAGVALGWGFHRLRNQQQIADLRHVIAQQQQQVKQSHTEVSMLAQDYDELKQTSSTTIDNLRRENAQIPNLNQNLDKSQLLVSQLMQKHEAQIRAYASENESLKAKVKHLDDREQALNKLQSDVERGRRELNNARVPSATSDTTDSQRTTVAKGDTTIVTETDKATDKAIEAKAGSQGSDTIAAALAAKNSNAISVKGDQAGDDINTTTGSAQNEASGRQSSELKKAFSANTTPQTIAELTELARAKAAREKAAADTASAADHHDVDVLDMSADMSGEAGSLTVALAEADVVLAAIDKRREEELLIEDDEVIDASEFDVGIDDEDDNELELLFDRVDQHDDLQTIFGIGPVTERGLNKLGITSYSQLAELKRHDIEKIAGALEIVPGKIERENWVGNARRQLEDVLEEL